MNQLTTIMDDAKAECLSDVQKETRPYFFTASTVKFVLMSICTFGIYELYWFYKNWVLIKESTNNKLMPFWRMLFAHLWAYSCFKEIQSSAKAEATQQLSSIGFLAFLYFILVLFWKLPEPYNLISILSFLPLIPANSAAIAVNKKVAPDHVENSAFSGLNWLGLALGGLLLLLALIGSFSETNSTKNDIVKPPSTIVMSSPDKNCQITLPSSFKTSTTLNKNAVIQATDSTGNIGVLVFNIDKRDVSVENINDGAILVKQNMANTLTSPKVSIPIELVIDGKKGIQYQIEGSIDKTNFVYLVLVVESSSLYYTIYAYTTPSRFENEENELNEIIHSFKAIN